MDSRTKKKKRKAKKGEATKRQPLDNKSPRSVSVSLSDRYTTLPSDQKGKLRSDQNTKELGNRGAICAG
jgi:hypothetical protein